MDIEFMYRDAHGNLAEVQRRVDRELSKLQKRLSIAEQAVTVLFENAECRGDEDCDHCYVIQLYSGKVPEPLPTDAEINAAAKCL